MAFIDNLKIFDLNLFSLFPGEVEDYSSPALKSAFAAIMANKSFLY
jgi:hypothetical protein